MSSTDVKAVLAEVDVPLELLPASVLRLLDRAAENGSRDQQHESRDQCYEAEEDNGVFSFFSPQHDIHNIIIGSNKVFLREVDIGWLSFLFKISLSLVEMSKKLTPINEYLFCFN